MRGHCLSLSSSPSLIFEVFFFLYFPKMEGSKRSVVRGGKMDLVQTKRQAKRMAENECSHSQETDQPFFSLPSLPGFLGS